MGGVFISYRRSDNSYVAMMLRDRIARDLGTEAVYVDVDSIPLGIDFRTHIADALSHCSLVLAIIGKNWSGLNPETELSRLHDPSDYVRLELEAALSRCIPVIPVLVDFAALPDEEQLPDTLKSLRFRNAAELRPGHQAASQLESLCREVVRQVRNTTLRPSVASRGLIIWKRLRIPILLLTIVSLVLVMTAGRGWLERNGMRGATPAVQSAASAISTESRKTATPPAPPASSQPAPDAKLRSVELKASREARQTNNSTFAPQNARLTGAWDYDGPAHGGNWIRSLNPDGTGYFYGGRYTWAVDGERFTATHREWKEVGKISGDTIVGTGNFTGDPPREGRGYPPSWTWTMRRHDASVQSPRQQLAKEEFTVTDASCTQSLDRSMEVVVRGKAVIAIGSIVRFSNEFGWEPTKLNCGVWDVASLYGNGCRRRSNQPASSDWVATFRTDDARFLSQLSMRVTTRVEQIIPTNIPQNRMVESEAKCQ